MKFVSLSTAEDIVHDVFIKLWDKEIFGLPENQLKAILFISVKNMCIDHLRKKSKSSKISDNKDFLLALEEMNYIEREEEKASKELIIKKVTDIIDNMPEKRREIFEMYYLKSMKSAEIADYMKVSVRTVENQIYRALLFLKKNIFLMFF